MLPVLAMTVLGCGTRLPDPDPREVVPSFGYFLQDTAVRIRGERFYPQVGVDAAGQRGADIDASFQAVLIGPDSAKGRYSLRGVTLSSAESLAAVVPAGLPAGSYALEVVGPSGAVGDLPAAYTVTETLAERIGVDADAIVYPVFEAVSFRVGLYNRRGEPVLSDAEVEVSLSAEDGDVVASLDGSELLDASASTGTVIGRLGSDGAASVGLLVETPDLVTVSVSVTDGRSAVAEGTLKLLFEPGDERITRVSLPTAGFSPVAGAPFLVGLEVVDQFGNRVDDDETVVLRDTCRDFVSAPFRMSGVAALGVTLERASTLTCPETRLTTVVGPEGESPSFVVQPGPTVKLTVEVSAEEVVAGEPIAAFVAPSDAYGNRSAWAGGALTVTDSVGGIADDGFSCTSRVPFFCTATPTRAAPAVRLVASTDDGTEGESDVFAVLADAPATIAVAVDADPVTCGEPFSAVVDVTDRWGNAIAAERFSDDLLWAITSGRVGCAAAGDAAFACVTTVARAAERLSVAWPEYGLVSESAAFDAVNGALSAVDVSAPAKMNAGEAERVAFAGYDAWGNPFLVGDDVPLDLSDSSGTAASDSIVLSSGAAMADVVITKAGTTRLRVTSAGALLGTSAPIDVVAATAMSLDVDIVNPWGFSGEPLAVNVSARDAWGNVAAIDASGEVEFDGELGALALARGAGTGWVTPSRAVASASVVATVGALSGTSSPIIVARRCADGPTAAVSFGGRDEAIACWDPGSGEAEVIAALGGSTAGSSPLSVWQAAIGERDAIDDGAEDLTLFATAPGVFEVQALVVDDSGCGGEVQSRAWVGRDDGEAVGPIDVHIDAAAAVGLSAAPVRLSGATTCTGDPASGAAVLVRSTRGGLTGPAPTSAGLSVALDASGAAAFDLDASTSDAGGVVTLTALGSGGVAMGQGEGLFSGDNRRPRVISMTPAGDTASSVDRIVVAFSEPVLEDTVVDTAFSVTGPVEVAVDVVTLDVTGTEATIWLSGPIDAGAAGFAVTVGGSVRDEAGNRLDGAESGAASDWTGGFGAVGELGPVSSCSAGQLRFRPDGDDGPSEEADAVSFALAAAAVPGFWSIKVMNIAGDVIRSQRPVATGATDTWAWDGRDDSGATVENGAYVLEVYAQDEDGARGTSCFSAIEVDNLEVLYGR
jgi:hypothetical protein